MTADVLGQALAYAAAGWPVFPCKPGQKAPDTAHGFKDATTDPAVIRAWWPPGSRRNVAIATGAPGPDVLDVDVKPDGSGFAAFNRLKRAGLLTGACTLVRTRSGGLHAYYAGTSQPSGRLVRYYLDFKAAGGYVLAPPSFVEADDTGPAGLYELLDKRQADGQIDWQAVCRLLDPPRPRLPTGHVRAGPAPGLTLSRRGWPSAPKATGTADCTGPPAASPKRAAWTRTLTSWSTPPSRPGSPNLRPAGRYRAQEGRQHRDRYPGQPERTRRG